VQSSNLGSIDGPVRLPIRGGAYERPTESQLAALRKVSSATASATLNRMGVRNVFLRGPKSLADGNHVVGSALTLQFMPQRDDIASGQSQEYIESRTALWAVFDAAQSGDMLVIAAEADPETGCVGEMLGSYFANQGGVGIVVDGCIRDWPKVRELKLPIWSTGTTPNYASQAGYFPWAYDIPISCGGALVLPGDAIVADDDGVVVVPHRLIDELVSLTQSINEWETFARQSIDDGGRLSKYYPLSDEAKVEYEEWQHSQKGVNTLDLPL